MAAAELGAEEWLARGIEEYKEHRVAAAAESFEKAATLDPESLEAHLALGAARLTLYVGRPTPASDYLFAVDEISEIELAAHEESERAILAEQNLTNWPLAEKSLRRANQLDPQNTLVIEYLGALYFHWKNPSDEEDDRTDQTKQWLERLLELQPEHKYANFQCGMILTAKVGKLMPNHGRYPPPNPEPDLASLRGIVGPLLEEANRHLKRALALAGDRTAAAHFIEIAASMETYLVDPEEAARELHQKMNEWFRKAREAKKQTEEAGPSGSSGTITFSLTPEAIADARARPFPPNPWSIAVGPTPI